MLIHVELWQKLLFENIQHPTLVGLNSHFIPGRLRNIENSDLQEAQLYF